MSHFEHSIQALGRDPVGRSKCSAGDMVTASIGLACVRCGWSNDHEHRVIEAKAQRMQKQGISMTKGMSIEVYEHPLTRQALEGQAIVKSIEAGPYKRTHEGRKLLEYILSVRFVGDDFNVVRRVFIEA